MDLKTKLIKSKNLKMPLCLPFRSFFIAPPTISKHAELPEPHSSTLARHTSVPPRRISTRAHDAFYHERRADLTASFNSRTWASAWHEATGLRFSSRGPDPRFAIALRIRVARVERGPIVTPVSITARGKSSLDKPLAVQRLKSC